MSQQIPNPCERVIPELGQISEPVKPALKTRHIVVYDSSSINDLGPNPVIGRYVYFLIGELSNIPNDGDND